jgi:succinate-semialdehyde dehydrogenase/glutarate-semialdehyde dehydrogenase
MKSINPTTEELIAEYSELSFEQIDAKLVLAQRAFGVWRQTNFTIRKEKMLVLARLLHDKKRILGEIATREMGKPITQAMAEVEKCATVCEYYANNAETILKEEVVVTDASESFVRFDPIGVVLAVMPWNFPYWQVLRFIVPAVMAGNVGILKHASNVQGCANAIEKVFLEAGFPEGLFQNLSITSDSVGGIIRDRRVKAVTLTGSEYAGRKVAEVAGDEVKHTVLELGGSDPFIVLVDADLDLVEKMAPLGRLQNCGQSCIAAKRFIVVKDIADEFLRRFKDAFENYIVGDPMDEKTMMGPLVNLSSLEEIDKQVHDSIAFGAQLVTGGKRLDRKGFFYAPTILSHVKKNMRAYNEEIFGPVASVIVVKDENEAVEVANDTMFGLGSSIWTRDIEKAKYIASQMNAGNVFINAIVKSDPRLPFGGVGRSGYGRELSHYGMKEFVNIKTVWVQ